MKVLCSGIVAGGDASVFFVAIRKLDLFASMSDVQLYKVLFYGRTVEFDAGETVFKQGDPGETFYAIQSGRVEARVPRLLLFRKVLGVMGPGDYFGELALLLSRPRAATVVCVKKTVCFALDRRDLEPLMSKHPDIAALIRAVARRRLGDGPGAP